MAQTTIEVSGLANFIVNPGTDDDSVAFVFTDVKGQSSGYLIGPEALNKILLPLLGLATKWAEKPDLQVETLTGAKNALPAQRMILERGRDASECAVRMFVGKVELTFLIPLNEVVSASAKLVSMIKEAEIH